ncbi:SpoIIE family protein phosphatase [Cryobacterium sp. BB307]|uniref:PP2C family protein-serine/threonine phosphatase n=1 Tax=Cryobacterium sp. BB307 TaxID=2716317 RepID=UPI0014471FB2|nr:SpoIIE family protein phosphatase [Cryobacterium sp. BB307]
MAAVIGSFLIPGLIVSNLAALVVGAILILGVTLFAGIVTLRPALSHLALVVPAVDFVAIGVLRFATGETQSIFASLVVLPVLWVSSIAGRRYVAYAIAGAFTSVILPVLLGVHVEVKADEIIRAAFNPVAFGVAAFVVNELARQARRQVKAAQLKEQVSATELTRAAAVQRAMLPKDGSSLEGFDVAGVCVPSKSVGGDFFDWYPADGGLALTLGDVMGKGVGAGMIAATARAVMRSAVDDARPTVALERLAACLNTELSEEAAFVTLFHARMTPDGRVRYVDAGHGLTLHVHADGTVERLASLDLPVGVDDQVIWNERELTLNPGDMLLSFSDGVLDLGDGTLSAVDEVAKIAAASGSATEVAHALSTRASRRSNPDDVTLVALHRQPVSAAH